MGLYPMGSILHQQIMVLAKIFIAIILIIMRKKKTNVLNGNGILAEFERMKKDSFA